MSTVGLDHPPLRLLPPSLRLRQRSTHLKKNKSGMMQQPTTTTTSRPRQQPRRAGMLLLVVASMLPWTGHAFLLPTRMPRPSLPSRSVSSRLARSSTTSTATPPPPPTPTTSTKAADRVLLQGLQADRFRHPLDQQATESLRSLPGLEWIVRRFMTVVEEVVYLDNISSAILVGPTQMPALHASLVDAAKILDLPGPLPELYIKQSPIPNAYTMAIQGRRTFIVVHTCLLDLLTPAELQVVLAHELTHIKCEHGVFITAANALTLGLYQLGGSVGRMLGDRLSGLLFAWLRAAEFSCDRGALLVAQDLHVVLSTLLKLVGGSQSQAHQLNVEAFLQQARSYDKAVGTPVGRLLRNQLEPSLTHPLPVLRVRELDRWYRSEMYSSIVARGVKGLKGGEGGEGKEKAEEGKVNEEKRGESSSSSSV